MRIGTPQPKLLLDGLSRREPSWPSGGPVRSDSVRSEAVRLISRYDSRRHEGLRSILLNSRR
jgi:hypothetical protein